MPFKKTLYTRFGKRAFDVCGVLMSTIISIPLISIVAFCIALTSRGTVLFAQERMGKNFSRFKLLKFRTMVVGAAAMGPLVTKGTDPRITTIGRFLRKSKLDELPQLFNVLKGDMSIVGPRPEVEKYALLFRDKYESILSIRPGITDYATLEYRDEQEVLNQFSDTEEGYIKEVLPAKIALYEKYLREISFTTDLKIIAKTMQRILF
jgi:lipopolysaccharide/colanic/teichoic acid biosynthesis glycosyltransferase